MKPKKKSKKKINRSGKSRFTKIISFRVPNLAHKMACKKSGGKKHLGKNMLNILNKWIESEN